jgi:hypothetical protein
MKDIVVYVGNPLTYQLPKVIDPDNDEYLTPKIDIGPMIRFVEVVNQNILIFTPEELDVGEYKIKITLEDQNPIYSLRDKIYIIVKVKIFKHEEQVLP